MLADLAQIPTWALVALGTLAFVFIALVVAVCRMNSELSRAEEQMAEDEAKYNAANAQALRSATRKYN